MAITTVIPIWIEQVLNSYEQGEKCVDLIAKLSIDPNSIPNHSLSNGLLRYQGRRLIGDTGQ
jgi:hypothetical protein